MVENQLKTLQHPPRNGYLTGEDKDLQAYPSVLQGGPREKETDRKNGPAEGSPRPLPSAPQITDAHGIAHRGQTSSKDLDRRSIERRTKLEKRTPSTSPSALHLQGSKETLKSTRDISMLSMKNKYSGTGSSPVFPGIASPNGAVAFDTWAWAQSISSTLASSNIRCHGTTYRRRKRFPDAWPCCAF
ncbi:hypothetical protein CKAH01_02580 [Colletotrichum kahawae]|uniref:Uncharacterized protein n=1 Tax=Colletotrichum kahawae TaxID=34407 RepID=A0AAD9XWP3_COLKA|nr:hypothetical protein CKAH01_02580 [Colletotrichum kahawae]